MIDRTTKLRWRRRFRRGKKQVEDIGMQAEDNLEQHFFKRLSKLTKVRRFMAAWVLLFTLLIGITLYQTRALGQNYLVPTPASGGIYTEGILGTFTNASPLYAASSVDNSVERLVFSGLFKYNQQNKLVGDLAQSYKVDKRGTIYTVNLKDNLKWHDGMPLTADDVVFTYQSIQNPDAKSPLAGSWQGIKVKKIDAKTVQFTLPSILSAFPYSMTNGIVPKHILDGVPPAQLRSLAFNTSRPVGSGPYKWEAIEVTGTNPEERQQQIGLVPNDDYNGGKPHIEKIIIRTFQDETKLANAFNKQELNAAAGLSVMPEAAKKDLSARALNIPLTSEVMAFFKTTSPIFSNVQTRRAIADATDLPQLLEGIDRRVLPVSGPLLRNQVGFDNTIKQTTSNPQQAAKLLEEAGWKLNDSGQRFKAGQPLQFSLTTQKNSVYDYVAHVLKKQWEAVGAKVDIVSLEDNELQSVLANHNYDVLLYGIALGADPDVFAFWHSSQADPKSATRLNFSEYNSKPADRSLEAGRTRSDDSVRQRKYKPFLQAWQTDVPAVALYQPRYLYLVREPLFGFAPTMMNGGADRFNNVEDWMIRRSDQAQD